MTMILPTKKMKLPIFSMNSTRSVSYFAFQDLHLPKFLFQIKAEREEERKIEEVKKQEEEERIRTENILR